MELPNCIVHLLEKGFKFGLEYRNGRQVIRLNTGMVLEAYLHVEDSEDMIITMQDGGSVAVCLTGRVEDEVRSIASIINHFCSRRQDFIGGQWGELFEQLGLTPSSEEDMIR